MTGKRENKKAAPDDRSFTKELSPLQLIEIDACTQCGECLKYCPVQDVTGAAGGLGKAFAVECASRGWDVYLSDLNPAPRRCDNVFLWVTSLKCCFESRTAPPNANRGA